MFNNVTIVAQMEEGGHCAISEFGQIAYCLETGDIVAVIDKDEYLQVNIPRYETI